MEMERAENEQIITYSISGSLSGAMHSAIHFFETVTSELDVCEKDIHINLENVMFMDSMAIGLTVGLLLKSSEKSVSVRLKNVPEHLRKLLDSTNIIKIFPEMYAE